MNLFSFQIYTKTRIWHIFKLLRVNFLLFALILIVNMNWIDPSYKKKKKKFVCLLLLCIIFTNGIQHFGYKLLQFPLNKFNHNTF